MIEFHGKPFLEYLVEAVRDQGFDRILLLLGYLPKPIRDYFEDGGRWGVSIEYSVSAEEDDTGRRSQCTFRFRFKVCDACGAENDIAARRCHGCEKLLVDADDKLKEALRLKDAKVLRVSGMQLEATTNGRGLPRLKVSNSYRRLLDVGFWAPTYPSWGHQNRTCAVRVSAPGRFEVKIVDSSNNPYLVATGLLKAADDGIRRNLDPGAPEHKNVFDVADEYENRGVRKLPMSLGQANEDLEHDQTIREALPGEMYDVYMHYKRDEWEKFLATVTEWDIETYMDVLP